MNKLFAGCALAALAASSANAQSTGSQTIENADEIVVTGTATRGVNGVVVPDVPKTRSILTQELIGRQIAGQSILNTINLVPGVNYTNSDPYGSAGGNLRIRGFPGNRVALLWDGLPLNDTGNYAIFGNQQGDPEIIDQVLVNLGTTDVDSPTPSAAGGVVSYRTIVPSKDFGVQLRGSIGDFDYGRGSAMIQTGDIFGTGVRGFIEASDTQYHKFRGPGQIHKSQYNARLYKPLASNGDFVSISGHYNRNRNASYNNGLASDFANGKYFDYNNSCFRPTPGAGVQNESAGSTNNINTAAACTNFYGLRINPSNTANIRASARYTITPGLIFTIDPGYQYTLANGGGTTVFNENDVRLRSATAGGTDLNGDGDIVDMVRLYTPNTTRTNRYTLLSSLIYEVNDNNSLRVAYSFDRGYHRQTAQAGYINNAGIPLSPFGGKHEGVQRVVSVGGVPLQGRSRYSIAQLNQISGEYFGHFLEDKLTITAGVRAPFFERKLNQTCYTANAATATFFGAATAAAGGASVTSGNPYCFGTAAGLIPATAIAPFKKKVKYSPVLPSAGVTYKFADAMSVYASYGKNFSTPSTDNLYRSVTINPKPETTNVFEAGYRYQSSKVQAQIATYYNKYRNRIVTAFDADPTSPTFGTSTDRNVGSARSYGVDAQVAVKPVQPVSLYGFVSWINAKLLDNFQSGATSFIPTAGARFVETPEWQYGARAQVTFDPVSVGVQAKHVSSRYSTDDNGRSVNASNQLIYLLAGGGTGVTGTAITGVPIASNGKVDGYTTVDVDARVNASFLGMGDKTYITLNVINIFNKYYFGNLSTQNTLAGSPRFSIGAPRTFQGTLVVGF